MKFCIFRGWYLVNGSSESSNPYHFLRELNKIFQMHVNVLSKLWLIFCWHQQKIQKMSQFWHIIDHNLGSKLDNKTNDLIFSICYLSFIRWYFSFLLFKTFKVQFHGVSPPFPLCSDTIIWLLLVFLYQYRPCLSGILAKGAIIADEFTGIWVLLSP